MWSLSITKAIAREIKMCSSSMSNVFIVYVSCLCFDIISLNSLSVSPIYFCLQSVFFTFNIVDTVWCCTVYIRSYVQFSCAWINWFCFIYVRTCSTLKTTFFDPFKYLFRFYFLFFGTLALTSLSLGFSALYMKGRGGCGQTSWR